MNWYSEAESALEAIAVLGDNWDGTGALATDPDKLHRAGLALIKLSLHAEMPLIEPLRNGGVQLVWEEGDRYLEFSFDDECGYLYEQKGISDEGPIEDADDCVKLYKDFWHA